MFNYESVYESKRSFREHKEFKKDNNQILAVRA